jgi:hypothetical protein
MTGNIGSGLDGKIVFSVGAMGKATGSTASMVVQFQVRNKKESRERRGEREVLLTIKK